MYVDHFQQDRTMHEGGILSCSHKVNALQIKGSQDINVLGCKWITC